MKKAVIISICVAAVALIYFLSGKDEDKVKTNTALLSDAVSGADGKSRTRGIVTRETGPGEDETGWPYKAAGEETIRMDSGESVPAQENTASFRIQGEPDTQTYASVANFTKISASPQFTGYLVNFAANFEKINVSNQSTYRHVISMMLPTDVTPGVYNEKSSPFIVQFFGSESGVLYTLDYNHSFSLSIDEWGGPGGRARGTFSGELKSANGTEVIQIRDGSFNVGIK
ncbi:MAG: hypothetical protein JXA07_08845 [Spirochaetes bacterium]|nr:hypothetical protein [Spirochaetota bacterium]